MMSLYNNFYVYKNLIFVESQIKNNKLNANFRIVNASNKTIKIHINIFNEFYDLYIFRI